MVTTGGGADFAIQSVAGAQLIGLDTFRGDPGFADFRGSGYAVVVIDTGIDLNHPAFGRDANRDGISDRILYAEDFSTDRDGTADDVNGHGTNVASIIGSSDPRFPGVAPDVGIIALQALSNSGGGRSTDIEAALEWVVRNASVYNIVAVNLSLGPSDNVAANRRNQSLGDEFARLAEAGIITTVAAGNSYFDFQTPGVSSIAADPNVIPVGALWSASFGSIEFASGAKDFETAAGRVASFSQRSATLDQVFAPGALITGAAPGGGSAAQGGTSQAAPFVAGMAALAQEIAEDRLGRRLTPEEFHDLLIDSAATIRDGDDEVDNVRNLNANLPRVDMLALARAIEALGGQAGPAPQPAPGDDFSADAGGAGRIAVGGTARGVIETAGDRDWFSLTLVEGRTYVFDQRGAPTRNGTLTDTLLALVDREGEVVATNDDDGAGLNARIEFTAQESGQVFLSAQAFGATTGSYELRVRDLGPRGGDDAAPNGSTTSILAPNGSVKRGVIEVNGDRDWHRVTLEAGVAYVVDLAGAGRDALADPFLRIRDGSGALLAANDDGGEGLNARIEFTPATSGRFFIEAGAFGEAGTGRYALTVAPVRNAGDIPADATTGATIAVGGFFLGALEEAGDRDWVRVTLESGSVYDIALAGDARSGSALADPFLRVRDASGTEIGFNDDFDGFDSRLDRFSVFETGTYFIEAAAFGDTEAGDYRLTVARLQGSAGDIPADARTAARAEPGGSFESTLDFVGDRDWIRLDVVAGRSYRIALDGAGADEVVDPLLRIYSSGGTLLATDDDSGGDRDSLLVFTPAASGRVFLEAASYLDGGQGGYRLSVADLGSADDFGSDPVSAGFALAGQTVRGVIDTPGDEDWIGFFLEAGEFYRFSLRGADASGGALDDPFLSIHDSLGFRIATDDDGGPGLDARLDFFAPETDFYFVAAQAFGQGTGSWLLETA
ncbi:MAG: S8 family serine peptidase [Pikeienuella sp.]|uniref:S8 family serine peptidase n=1 Tax=Pikeienuella sp. TaxID=2831957 RepID=UPI00391985F2